MHTINNITDLILFLNRIGQGHLTENIYDFTEEEQNEFLLQVNKLNKSYPGGLEQYTKSAKILLKNSTQNVNPYERFIPSVPVGEKVNFSSYEEVESLESIGREELNQTAFVLVAGGLGERLQYNGIKIGIEFELTTGQTFLNYYLDFIKAFNEKSELAIMTSDDTYNLTMKLLEDNNYYDFPKDQIIILKQEKVPAMIDNYARLAQLPGSLLIETKPHGNGDVHTLLFQRQLPQRWIRQGKKWIVVFQDTNPLVFRALPSALAVSKTKNLEVNSLTIPRKPGEAIGAICKLTKGDQNLTINVEYNQIGSLIPQEPIDKYGYSIFPGNVNCIAFSIEEYNSTLQKTQGLIKEFVNPKYTDSTKTKFKSSCRLECMYEEYPKLLENDNRVGITQVNRAFCFSTVKNDIKTASQKFQQNLGPESASTCEQDLYSMNREILKLVGVEVESSNAPEYEFQGIMLNLSPQIILKPSLGVTLAEIKQNIKSKKVSISKNSSVVFDLETFKEENGNYEIDGQFNLPLAYQSKSKYRSFIAIDENAPQYLQIRGYDVNRN
ncbi:hypothetical protein ABPG72_002655 [Tetrahymena utriculariae]